MDDELKMSPLSICAVLYKSSSYESQEAHERKTGAVSGLMVMSEAKTSKLGGSSEGQLCPLLPYHWWGS